MSDHSPYQPPSYPQQSQQPPSYPQSTPPGYAQPGYAAAAPYGYGGYQKTNVLAILSLVASIVGFLWILPLIGSVAGIVMGHISLGQIKRTNEKGRGLALAGLIVGYVGVALLVVGLVIIFSLIGWASTQSYTSY